MIGSLGMWNTSGASVRIRVLGPWWTWWWVRGALMLFTLTTMFALYRFRVQRLASFFAALREALLRWAPCGDGPPSIVLRRESRIRT